MPLQRPIAAAALAVALALALGSAHAAEPAAGIEQALQAALESRRGVTLHVGGQAIGGAVTRVEPGRWVELRSQAASRIVVRIDRIDAVSMP